MALVVIWTKEADTQLDQIIEYLENNWTQKEIKRFFTKLEIAISTIQNKPHQQKKSLRKPNSYEFQIIPQITLFYTFDATTLTILLLWPNRMNPKNI